MALPTTTLLQFQDYIWAGLPFQRSMAGREVVRDVVSAAVQEWPDELLSSAKAGSDEETALIQKLTEDVRRHLQLVYGDEKFGSLWIIALQLLLPIIINQMLMWWRRRKEHKGRVRIWRRKWINGTTEG